MLTSIKGVFYTSEYMTEEPDAAISPLVRSRPSYGSLYNDDACGG